MQQNVAERKAQVLAHKAAMDALRNELDKVKDGELESLRYQCQSDLGLFALLVLSLNYVVDSIRKSIQTSVNFSCIDIDS